MYESYETPEIQASIFYYEPEYTPTTPKRVFEILKQSAVFASLHMGLDPLTNECMRENTPDTQELFVKAYTESDALTLEWENEESQETKEYIYFRWDPGFQKRSQKMESNHTSWSIITFTITYSLLKDLEWQKHFMECVRALSHEVGAFFTKIEDMANGVELLERIGIQRYEFTYIQQIYWGNYIGQHLLSEIRLDKLRKMDLPYYQETDEGVFFTLTDNVLDFNSKKCEAQRRRIRGLIKKRIPRRIVKKKSWNIIWKKR